MLSRSRRATQLRIPDGDIERCMQVPQRHPLDDVTKTGLLARAVEPPIAVPLVDDIVMLGVEPARQFGMAPERIDGAVVVPTPVDVTCAAVVPPDVAELGVEHRLRALSPRRLEVPLRIQKRAVAESLDVLFPAPAGQILVPGIEIGLGVTGAAARRVV